MPMRISLGRTGGENRRISRPKARPLLPAWTLLVLFLLTPEFGYEPGLLWGNAPESTENFATETSQARKFGVYEVVLQGRGAVDNPFATRASITFTPPSGNNHAVTVPAFFDGGNVWRGRVYVTETGLWRWSSRSADDPLLNGRSGAFFARKSSLPGILRKDTGDPKQWMTDDGHWFLNIGDTAYSLFGRKAVYWKQFVRDDANLGVSTLRANLTDGWKEYWINAHQTKFNLETFQRAEARLRWILDRYPRMQVQLILFPDIPWGKDDQIWNKLPSTVRVNTMQYMIARLAAFPNIFLEITNDTFCTPRFPRNRAMAREVGEYFKNHDPWHHLLSFGPNRNQTFCFLGPKDDWVSYIAIESAWALSANAAAEYANFPMHVFLQEDYYEDARRQVRPQHPAYFYRWLMWSWLLSGGSATYGGRWAVLTPYSMTGSRVYRIPRLGTKYHHRLTGLDSIPYLVRYFTDHDIQLWKFTPDDRLASDVDGARNCRRIKAARRGSDEFLLYDPNALSCGPTAQPDPNRTPRLRVNLSAAQGAFHAEWFRPGDGESQDGGRVQGGTPRVFESPWKGKDVVLRLVRQSGR